MILCVGVDVGELREKLREREHTRKSMNINAVLMLLIEGRRLNYAMHVQLQIEMEQLMTANNCHFCSRKESLPSFVTVTKDLFQGFHLLLIVEGGV